MRRRTENRPKKRMSAPRTAERRFSKPRSHSSPSSVSGASPYGDVAQAQNITEAGLLYYFKSKEQLLEETLKYADRTNRDRHRRASWRAGRGPA